MCRWINPEKGRYYHAHLDNDLFGGWTLVLAWGGLRNRRGNMRVNHVPSSEVGLQRLQGFDKGYARDVAPRLWSLHEVTGMSAAERLNPKDGGTPTLRTRTR